MLDMFGGDLRERPPLMRLPLPDAVRDCSELGIF